MSPFNLTNYASRRANAAPTLSCLPVALPLEWLHHKVIYIKGLQLVKHDAKLHNIGNSMGKQTVLSYRQ